MMIDRLGLAAPGSAYARREFGEFGIENYAYVKPIVISGQKLQSIHAADGTPLTIVTDRDVAFATISRYDLQPVSVH